MPVTALIPTSLDYTDRDFDSIRLRLQGLIRSNFPTWTDFNVANFGNLLLELFAFATDVLGHYQDNQALEAFIAKATQRKNLIALARLIGYTAPGASAATATETFTLAAVPAANVTFPAGTIVKTADITSPVFFQLLAAVTIVAGQNPPTATGTVENSEPASDTFTSSGLANQEIVLGSTPFLDGSAVIAAGNGTYSIAPNNNFLSSLSTDRHFTIVVDQNDKATIRFGNGTNGAIPFGTITVDYKTGGGSQGNVEATAISKIEGRFTDALGNPVSVVVTNVAKASGGGPRASVEQIRVDAPLSLRTLTRTVAREDYEINAKKVSGVARVLMTTSNEDPGVAENTGILYVVPSSGGAPTQALKDAVHTMCTVTYPNTLTFTLLVQDPVYLTVNFTIKAFRRSTYTAAQMAAAIRAALSAFMIITNADGTPNTKIDFGYAYKNSAGGQDGRIPLDQFFNVVRDLPEVRRMGDQSNDFLINGTHADLTVSTSQFPLLGTVTIVDGDSGVNV